MAGRQEIQFGFAQQAKGATVWLTFDALLVRMCATKGGLSHVRDWPVSAYVTEEQCIVE
jgi:hypothetical protein